MLTETLSLLLLLGKARRNRHRKLRSRKRSQSLGRNSKKKKRTGALILPLIVNAGPPHRIRPRTSPPLRWTLLRKRGGRCYLVRPIRSSRKRNAIRSPFTLSTRCRKLLSSRTRRKRSFTYAQISFTRATILTLNVLVLRKARATMRYP